MKKATLRTIIEDRIFNLDGNSFQGMCDRFCFKLYPDDYTPVRAGGPKGDTKMDGYCPKAKIYFAAHATRGRKITPIKRKIESDLKGCLKQHKDVKKWIFLTNVTLLGEIETYVQNLRTKYPKVKIETWGHKKITEKILKFNDTDISEIIGLDLGVTVHLQSEIESTAQLLKEHKSSEALVLLERLWEQYNSAMTGNQKYRTRANIGHAYLAQDQYEKAAHCFLKAKQYAPENERARAREALAYLLLGNPRKANELAKALLNDFPEENLGRAVYVRSAPKELRFDAIEKMVPEHQREDSEVAMAIGEAAMHRGHYDIAEKYIGKALQKEPNQPQVKEVLGDLLLQRARIAEQAVNDRGPTKEEKEYLEKARELFTEALNEYQRKDLTASIVRVRLKRANVYMGLNNVGAMEADIIFAYQLQPTDPEVVYRYAGIKARAEDWDAAINLLEGLIGKGLRCSAELMLSQCLDRRNLEGDKKRAVVLLESRLNDLSKEEPDLRREYLATLVDLERQTAGREKAIETLETLPENIVSDEFVIVLRGETYRLDGRKDKAENEAKKVIEKRRPETSIQDKRRIATFLQVVGLYKEALELWKTLVQPEYIGRDTYRLMECAHQCEDVAFITEFAEKLRSKGLWERKLFELELDYHEKYHDDKGVRKVMEEFLANPPDQSYAPYVRLRLSLLGIRTEKKDLIETNPTKLPQVTEVSAHIGRWVATILRYGPEPIKGVEYAYELVRLNWNEKEAHMAMIDSILAPEGPTVDIKHPEEIVAPGIAVQYQEDDTHELCWHIIENSVISKPESSRNEFPIDHPISKEMLGKKRGAHFYLVKDGVQERTATIKNVFSKYIYRFQNCLEKFQKWFPGTQVIKKIIIKEKDGKPDLLPLRRLVEKDSEYVQRIEEIYSKNLIPIYTVANLKGRHIVEAMNYIISTPSLRLNCCAGTDEEMETAERALRESQNIVIGATALGTIFLMKSCEMLSRIPRRLIVSQGTIDDFRQLLRTYDNPKSVGVYSKEGFIPWTPENIEEIRKSLQELIDLVEKHCIVESGLIIGELETSRRSQLVQIFGQLGVESMLLAARAGHTLWTDDLATAELSRMEFGCQRVWTQQVVEYFCAEGKLDPDFDAEIATNLMHMRYYYTRPNVKVFLKAVDKTNGDVDKGPLSQALDWFGDSNVKIEGIDYIGAMFLKSLWQSGHIESASQTVTIRILERLSNRTQGMNVIHSWLKNVHNIFGIDVVNAKKVRDVIQYWLNGGGKKRIIIP